MDRDTAEPELGSMPGKRAQEWVEYHRGYAAPSEHSHDFVWDVTREADGPFATDVDGNVLLDFTCHIGAAPLGYNNEKILGPMREFSLVDPLKIAGQDMYFATGETPDDAAFPGSSHLMERLIETCDRYGMDTVFLSNSGGEAVENGMKIAYDHAEVPKHGVAFGGSFHGRTLGTLSVTNSGSVYTRKYPELPGVETVPFCSDRHCAGDCGCGFFTDDGSQLRGLLGPEGGHLDPAEIAFVVLEPVQGVGGYNFPSPEFAAEVQAVTDEYDIPLMVDEIQSGVGRTGEMWASDHYPLEPDIITAAKGLRVGATVSRSDLFPSEQNRLGSTWGGGDVLSSMQGALTLRAIDEYDLLENATRRGRQMRELLRDGAPDYVTDVRGKGLMLAVSFDSRERRNDVVEAALRRGMLTLGCGKRAIRLLPPLDVTEREIEMGAGILREAIQDAA